MLKIFLRRIVPLISEWDNLQAFFTVFIRIPIFTVEELYFINENRQARKVEKLYRLVDVNNNMEATKLRRFTNGRSKKKSVPLIITITEFLWMNLEKAIKYWCIWYSVVCAQNTASFVWRFVKFISYVLLLIYSY